MPQPTSVRWRTRSGIAVGSLAGRLSRAAGRGAGGTLPGRLLLTVDPGAIAMLARGRTCAVVSGTNGKTTTTRLLAAALGSRGEVLTNADGSNLAAGVAGALMRDPAYARSTCVLEVDELALPAVARSVAPEVFVLLNLSRDQLDRMTEVRTIVGRWRAMLADAGPAVVVANCDDPLVVAAVTPFAEAGGRVVWAAVGQPWVNDAALCPQCAAPWDFRPQAFSCAVCGFSRPTPSWGFTGDGACGPDGARVPLGLALPGRANRSNATIALAAAAHLGVRVEEAVAAMRTVTDVGGRYATLQHAGRSVRLLLAKNPAGWQEMLDQVSDEQQPLVVALNARAADGRDPSWIWDVPFELLRGPRRVIACGDRAADLSVRLLYADVGHATVRDPLEALAALPGQPVTVIANYTAFSQLLTTLRPA